MINKLKYWWYRNWKYRKEKFVIYFRETYFKPGDTISTSESTMICIGKNYYVEYNLFKLRQK